MSEDKKNKPLQAHAAATDNTNNHTKDDAGKQDSEVTKNKRPRLTHEERVKQLEEVAETKRKQKELDMEQKRQQAEENAAFKLEQEKKKKELRLQEKLKANEELARQREELRRKREQEKQEKEEQKLELLINAACDVTNFFRSTQGEPYATIREHGKIIHIPILSEKYISYLKYQYEKLGIGIFTMHEVRTKVVDTLFSNVQYAESYNNKPIPVCELHTRVALIDDTIYIDMNDTRGQIIKVTKEGWNIQNSAPVKFIRDASLLPYPDPSDVTPDLTGFKAITNYSDTSFPLAIAWMIQTFVPEGEIPIMSFTGSYGSGKSAHSYMAKAITDPNVEKNGVLISSFKNETNALMLSAYNQRCLYIDNVSYITPEISDALCTLVTGGTLRKRILFRDTDEIILPVKRPVIINGINDTVVRGDLQDRTITITLEKPEKEVSKITIERTFKEMLPNVFAAILQGLVIYLQRRNEVTLTKTTRLMDYAILGTALENFLGLEEGEFIELYEANKNESVQAVLENSIFYDPIEKLLDNNQGKWEGNSKLFYSTMKSYMDDNLFRDVPKENKIRNHLKSLAGSFVRVGIIMTFPARNRMICIERKGAAEKFEEVTL